MTSFRRCEGIDGGAGVAGRDDYVIGARSAGRTSVLMPCRRKSVGPAHIGGRSGEHVAAREG